MPRHDKPEILLIYEHMERPRICHTCEHYTIDGLCQLHQQEPPREFAATHKICPEYSEDVPF